MDKPTASSMADENSCIICIHLGSSSETNSNLGEIIKISRGITSLRAASTERQDGLLPHLQTEFVYAHSSCRQKYINKKYIGMYKNKEAMNLESKDVVVVSEDIDVLVILTALVDKAREIYFLKPSRGKVQQKIFSSKCLEKSLPNCKEHILFLHAFTGCDTTSAFFNKGKIKFAKNFEKRIDLHDSVKVFENINEDPNNILQAGVACILSLYGAPSKAHDLNTLRYNSFIKATAKNTSVLLSSLPPTTDAAFEHLKRVYLQIQVWLGNDVVIENWGWKYSNNMYIPITMNQLPAPDNLL